METKAEKIKSELKKLAEQAINDGSYSVETSYSYSTRVNCGNGITVVAGEFGAFASIYVDISKSAYKKLQSGAVKETLIKKREEIDMQLQELEKKIDRQLQES